MRISFAARPTGRNWYRAHNASVVAGYLEHRNLAHRVHTGAPVRIPGLAAGKIDPDRLPIEAGAIQIERDLVGVSGCADAMQPVLSHFDSRSVITRGCLDWRPLYLLPVQAMQTNLAALECAADLFSVALRSVLLMRLAGPILHPFGQHTVFVGPKTIIIDPPNVKNANIKRGR